GALAATRCARQPHDLRAAGVRIEPRAERFGAGAARFDPREAPCERTRRAVEDLASQCLDVRAHGTIGQGSVRILRAHITAPSMLTRPFGLFYSSAAVTFSRTSLVKSTGEEHR